MSDHPWQAWATYDAVGEVLELGAVFDDHLKKNSKFLSYSAMLANRICEDLKVRCKVTWGMWGGRLEPNENEHLSRADLEDIAKKIIEHPSWKALTESTRVFTFGRSWEE